MKYYPVLMCVAILPGFFLKQSHAEPVNLQQIPADAKALAHVDFDALRDSTVFQKIREKCLQMHPDAAKHMDLVRAFIGMDPRTDLHGITLYGTVLGKPTGVAIIHAKIDPAPLLRLSVLAPGHKVTKFGPYELHSWAIEHHGKSHPGAGAFCKEGLVLASSIEELEMALNLLDGKGTSLSSSSPLAGGVPAGTTVMARVAGIAEAKLPHKCPLAEQTEAVRFSMGEHNGQSFFRFRATMTNSEVTGQVKEVVDGGRALAQLSRTDELGKRLIAGLKVLPADKTLTVLWSVPANDVWTAIEKAAKKIIAHREKMKEMGWLHHSPPGQKKGPEHKAPEHKGAAAEPDEI